MKQEADCRFVTILFLQAERLLDDDGVFIVISYGNPEQRLHFLEQYDIDEPHFTPWIVEVQALCKYHGCFRSFIFAEALVFFFCILMRCD